MPRHALLLLVFASGCEKSPGNVSAADTEQIAPPVSVPVPVPVTVAVHETGTGTGTGTETGTGTGTETGTETGTGTETETGAETDARFEPADWDIAIGKWTFEDGELVSDGKVMSSLVYRKGVRARDLDFSVEVRFEKDEASAGILFREVGEDFYEDATFYQFEWYTRGSHHDRRLSFMKKNPFWVQLVEPRFPTPVLGKWIRFRVRAEGDFVQTFVDDEPVFAKHDTTFVREGRIGLHCFMPRRVRFRRPVLRVW